MSSFLPGGEGSPLVSKRRLNLVARRSELRDFTSRLVNVWAEHTAVTQGATSYPTHESCMQATPGDRVAVLRCASVTECQLIDKSGRAVTHSGAGVEKARRKCAGTWHLQRHTRVFVIVRNSRIHWGNKTVTAWGCDLHLDTVLLATQMKATFVLKLLSWSEKNVQFCLFFCQYW